MSRYWAKVLNGVVQNVIVAGPEFFQTFHDNTPGYWVETDPNTYGGVHYDPVTKQPSADQTKALRKNYASVGSFYDQGLDMFIPQKLHNSWVLNVYTGLWDPPIPEPSREGLAFNQFYQWNEAEQRWDLNTYDFMVQN